MQPKILIRSLKGSAAQILLAFLFARRAMDVKEIQSWTNLKRETIYSSMAALDGLIVKQTLAHGRDVFLPGGDLLPLFQVLISDAPELQESVKRTSGATTTTAIEERKTDRLAVVVDTPQESVKRTSGNKNDVIYETYGVTFEKNLAACMACNIGEPKASKIANMPWVSPEFIKAHVDSLYSDQRIGLAIVRIESNELPRTWLEEIPLRNQDGDNDEEGDDE